jgi:hypothetical protein
MKDELHLKPRLKSRPHREIDYTADRRLIAD